ncbi:MAG: hypothetical protein ABI231_00515 [Candidatus Tumulicola sp.]
MKRSTKDGTICVPSFHGWGGSMAYPNTGHPATMTLISSTTAYNPPLFPPPGSTIFFLQVGLNTKTTFGSSWNLFYSCSTVAKAGKYGGAVTGLGNSFKNRSVTSFVISIVPGKLSGTKC